MIHLVEMCVHVRICLHSQLKTIADICFLLASYVDWRKIRTSRLQVNRHGQDNFSEGSGSLAMIMSYSGTGVEMLSLTASFSSFLLELLVACFCVENINCINDIFRGHPAGVLLWSMWPIQRTCAGVAWTESRGSVRRVQSQVFSQDRLHDCHTAGLLSQFQLSCIVHVT